ncbi:MAG: hypothetical protein ABI697_04795 [Devosia sp.]
MSPLSPFQSRARLTALALSVLAFFDAIWSYVWTGNGIHGSEGALLVVISTLLLAGGLFVVWRDFAPYWLGALFHVLIFIGFIGTAVAAYFLEDWILMILSLAGLLCWLGSVLFTTRPEAMTARS